MKKIIIPGLVAGFVILVISFLFNVIITLIFPSLQQAYQNTNLFRPWSDPLMYLAFLYPFVLGIILAAIWDKVKTLFQGTDLRKSYSFSIFYVLLTIPGMIMSYSSFQISKWMVLSWVIGIVFQSLGAVFVLTKMNK